jgi:hypothetical protein
MIFGQSIRVVTDSFLPLARGVPRIDTELVTAPIKLAFYEMIIGQSIRVVTDSFLPLARGVPRVDTELVTAPIKLAFYEMIIGQSNRVVTDSNLATCTWGPSGGHRVGIASGCL